MPLQAAASSADRLLLRSGPLTGTVRRTAVATEFEVRQRSSPCTLL
jgi:hypothetical protein